MNITREFEDKFKAEIKGKSEDEILAIIKRYGVADERGQLKYLIRKEMEQARASNPCKGCTTLSNKRGIIPAIADKYSVSIRTLYYYEGRHQDKSAK